MLSNHNLKLSPLHRGRCSCVLSPDIYGTSQFYPFVRLFRDATHEL